jgi:hypothetical protein
MQPSPLGGGREGTLLKRETSPVIDRTFRAKGLLSAECLLRIMYEVVRCYHSRGDLEDFLIILAVSCISNGAALRSYWALTDGDSAPPESMLRPVSRRAVAASTGLPRETVRRRIAQLVATDQLIEVAGGVRCHADLLADPRTLEFATAVIGELERGPLRATRLKELFAPRG